MTCIMRTMWHLTSTAAHSVIARGWSEPSVLPSHVHCRSTSRLNAMGRSIFSKPCFALDAGSHKGCISCCRRVHSHACDWHILPVFPCISCPSPDFSHEGDAVKGYKFYTRVELCDRTWSGLPWALIQRFLTAPIDVS